METTYFVLGMLSIVGAIFAALVVWGIVKINGLLRKSKYHEEDTNNLSRTLWENHNDLREDFGRQFNELERNISSEFGKHERNIYSEFERRDRELDTRFKDMYDEINHTRSYIDSRIDKVTGTLGAKQVIKG